MSGKMEHFDALESQERSSAEAERYEDEMETRKCCGEPAIEQYDLENNEGKSEEKLHKEWKESVENK